MPHQDESRHNSRFRSTWALPICFSKSGSARSTSESRFLRDWRCLIRSGQPKELLPDALKQALDAFRSVALDDRGDVQRHAAPLHGLPKQLLPVLVVKVGLKMVFSFEAAQGG